MSDAVKYRPDVNGLRAVAVILVLIYHLGFGAPGGYLGVDVFFVISGYLITGIINRQLNDASFSFGDFYSRRARRILPALLLVLLVTSIAAGLLLLPSDFVRYAKSLVASLLSISNFWFWLLGGYFGPVSEMEPLLHTWSLGVEEQFYIIVPVALFLIHKWKPESLQGFLLLICVVSFGLALYLSPARPSAVFFFSPMRAWELALGGVLATSRLPEIDSRTTRELVSWSGLLLILVPAFLFSSETNVPWMLLPCLGTGALIWVGASGESIPRRALSSFLMVGIGLISYSLYLWHWPLIVMAKHLQGVELGAFTRGLIGMLSLLLAWLTWKYVETPFRNKNAVNSTKFIGVCCVSLGALAVVAGMIVASRGMEWRFDDKIVALDHERVRNAARDDCFDYRGMLLTRDSLCSIGADVTPSILIWGDSYAHAMLPAFEAALTKMGSAAYFAAAPGCPPVPGVNLSFLGETNRRCQEFNRGVMRLIQEGKSLDTVIISAAWVIYASEDYGYILTNEGGARQGHALAEGVASLADELRGISPRTKLVVIAQTPSYGKSVPLAMIDVSLRSLSFPILSTEDWKQQSKQAHEAFAIASFGRKIEVVDPAEWFCRGAVCKFSNEEGLPFYYDHGHLNSRGAQFIAEPMQASLRSILRASNDKEISTLQ